MKVIFRQNIYWTSRKEDLFVVADLPDVPARLERIKIGNRFHCVDQRIFKLRRHSDPAHRDEFDKELYAIEIELIPIQVFADGSNDFDDYFKSMIESGWRV